MARMLHEWFTRKAFASKGDDTTQRVAEYLSNGGFGSFERETG